MPAAPSLSAQDLSVQVPGQRLVDTLNAEFLAGDFVAILGKNGAGKSLTLQTLAGLRAPSAGVVNIRGRPLDTLTRRDIAQQLALLPQHAEEMFPLRGFDSVLMGRHPHIKPMQLPSAADHEIAWQVMRELRVERFADRDVATLSGGERRRLAIAQTLAQTPTVFLLDEPSNHLDPQHQLAVCELFARRARSQATVIAVFHDLNLAARFANRVLLLHGDGRWHLGATREIMTTTRLSALFDVEVECVPWRDRQLFVAAAELVGREPA